MSTRVSGQSRFCNSSRVTIAPGAGVLQQDGENLKRLTTEFQFQPSLAHLACLKVKLERRKTSNLGVTDRFLDLRGYSSAHSLASRSRPIRAINPMVYATTPMDHTSQSVFSNPKDGMLF